MSTEDFPKYYIFKIDCQIQIQLWRRYEHTLQIHNEGSQETWNVLPQNEFICWRPEKRGRLVVEGLFKLRESPRTTVTERHIFLFCCTH